MMPLFCEDGARCSVFGVVSWGISQMLGVWPRKQGAPEGLGGCVGGDGGGCVSDWEG